MRQGLAAYRATGAELLRPYFLALLAEVYGNVRQPEEGLSLLDVALRQQTKSLELRTAISLSRLWQGQGRRKEEAHQLLVEVYDWFSEGFDTGDLQETRVLLNDLSSV